MFVTIYGVKTVVYGFDKKFLLSAVSVYFIAPGVSWSPTALELLYRTLSFIKKKLGNYLKGSCVTTGPIC